MAKKMEVTPAPNEVDPSEEMNEELEGIDDDEDEGDEDDTEDEGDEPE